MKPMTFEPRVISPDALQALADRSAQGTLTAEEIKQALPTWDSKVGWGLVQDSHGNYLDPRATFIRTVGFAILTTEFLESLRRLVEGKRVLEVAAGKGVLAANMQRLGADWTATDNNSWPAAVSSVNQPTRDWRYQLGDHVQVIDAVTAANTIPHDVLFFSWWPYGSKVDAKLINLGKPTVVVGEPPRGCTGSEHGCRYSYAESVYNWFEDCLQWMGMHDCTMLYNWK